VIKHLWISFVSDQIFPYERSKIFLWLLTLLFWALTEGFFVQFLWSCSGNLFSLYPVIIPQRNCKHSSIHTNMPYERSYISLWAIKPNSYDRSCSCSERSQRVLLSNFFHHALEIYLPYIQLLHHKGIVSNQAFTKICLMSVHNMFMSDQTIINQLCERSYISLWAIKNTFMYLLPCPKISKDITYITKCFILTLLYTSQSHTFLVL
jgi:hypothetical protein